MNTIDARGLACPAPVLQTKTVIEEANPDLLSVIVDNQAAEQNVSRFLESRHYTATVEQKGSEFVVTGRRAETVRPEDSPEAASEHEIKKIMVMVATDRMGWGDDELGKLLMINFIKTLKEMGPELWRLVFVNNGVKLTIEGAHTLEDIKALEGEGLQILVCGTCLDYFKLLDKKRVGETTNMLDIVTAMQLADKVINI
jgi:selenium metabolism protein YedF